MHSSSSRAKSILANVRSTRSKKASDENAIGADRAARRLRLEAILHSLATVVGIRILHPADPVVATVNSGRVRAGLRASERKMTTHAGPQGTDVIGGPLPSDVMARSLPHLPNHSLALRHIIGRLRSGMPLTVTAIGMSNTFDFGGCFGEEGCSAWDKQSALMHRGRGKQGWGAMFMRWLVERWPAKHQLYNRGAGASNPTLATTCIASHLAPRTDLLVVDFNLANWGLQHQEHLARTIAAMPRPPLVVYLGLINWCKQVGRGRGESIELWQRRVATSCAADLKGSHVTDADPVGSNLARVARHYGHVFIDVFHALRPLMNQIHPASAWTRDGVHGFYSHGRSQYYGAIASFLAYLITRADEAIPPTLHKGIPPTLHTGIPPTLLARLPPDLSPTTSHAILPAPDGARGAEHVDPAPGPAALDPASDPVPPPMDLGGISGGASWSADAAARTLACYAWLSRNLEPPPVLRNVTARRDPGVSSDPRHPGGVSAGGWVVSEVTMHGAKKRKPGLLSTVEGDSIDLQAPLLTPRSTTLLTPRSTPLHTPRSTPLHTPRSTPLHTPRSTPLHAPRSTPLHAPRYMYTPPHATLHTTHHLKPIHTTPHTHIHTTTMPPRTTPHTHIHTTTIPPHTTPHTHIHTTTIPPRTTPHPMSHGTILSIQVAMPGIPRSTHACIGITYLRSYERMGVARVECVSPCSCEASTFDGLDTVLGSMQ